MGHPWHCASRRVFSPYSGALRGFRPMAITTRLTASQKSALVARFSAGEGGASLAVAFGCSVNTVNRVAKAALPPAEYERLKQGRSRGSRPSVDEAPPAAPEAAAPEATAPVEVDDRGDDSGEGGDADAGLDGQLAIDDADDFGDDGDDGGTEADEELTAGDAEQEDGLGDGDEPPAAMPVAALGPVTCLPLAEAELPTSVYMLVDKAVELEVRPLSEFSELGELPPGEEALQALQVFVNPRHAKRQCGRTQRVIKIPDARIFERTAHYLIAQGIRRVVIENGLYSLPGA